MSLPSGLPVLSLDGFGVSIGARVILGSVTLSLPPRSLTALFGPMGAGKSTLIRTLAGSNDAHPSLRVWGTATLLGQPITGTHRPALVTQSAKLILGTVLENMLAHEPQGLPPGTARRDRAIEALERSGLGEFRSQLDRPVVDLSVRDQRRLAIARTCVAEPEVLFVDEPTAGLSDEDAALMLEQLRREATLRTVLFVTHRQDHARAVAHRAALLANGRIVADAEVPKFFDSPQGSLAAQFVRTGSCPSVTPDAKQEDLSDDTPPPPPLPEGAHNADSNDVGPRSFRWLIPGKLAGCARPGLMGDLDEELAALSRWGIRVLVTLEEPPPPVDKLTRCNIESVHAPFADMSAPSIVMALELCESIDQWIAQGKAVCVHCRAGLGRTGTILVSWLIHRGESGPLALERARAVERYWVESDAQLEFLGHFWRALNASDLP